MEQDLPADGEWWRWMVLPLRRYARFTGRSGRREFWWYSLFLALGYIVPLVFLAISSAGSSGIFGTAIVGFWTLGFFLVNIIPGLAVSVRRFHDLGLSGWLLLAAYLAMLFLSLLGWIGYLVAMALPGQARDNAYGPVVGHDVSDVFI